MNQVDQFLFDKTNAYRAEEVLGPLACELKANVACTEGSKGQCEAYAANSVSAKQEFTYCLHVWDV
jgi:hypothetical protein